METRTIKECRIGAQTSLLAAVLYTHMMLRAVELLLCPIQAGEQRQLGERKKEGD